MNVEINVDSALRSAKRLDNEGIEPLVKSVDEMIDNLRRAETAADGTSKALTRQAAAQKLLNMETKLLYSADQFGGDSYNESIKRIKILEGIASGQNLTTEAAKKFRTENERSIRVMERYNRVANDMARALRESEWVRKQAERKGAFGLAENISQQQGDFKDLRAYYKSGLQNMKADDFLDAEKQIEKFSTATAKSRKEVEKFNRSFLNGPFGSYSILMSGMAASLFVFQELSMWFASGVTEIEKMEKAVSSLKNEFHATTAELREFQAIVDFGTEYDTLDLSESIEQIRKFIDEGYSMEQALERISYASDKAAREMAGTTSQALQRVKANFKEIWVNRVQEIADIIDKPLQAMVGAGSSSPEDGKLGEQIEELTEKIEALTKVIDYGKATSSTGWVSADSVWLAREKLNEQRRNLVMERQAEEEHWVRDPNVPGGYRGMGAPVSPQAHKIGLEDAAIKGENELARIALEYERKSHAFMERMRMESGFQSQYYKEVTSGRYVSEGMRALEQYLDPKELRSAKSFLERERYVMDTAPWMQASKAASQDTGFTSDALFKRQHADIRWQYQMDRRFMPEEDADLAFKYREMKAEDQRDKKLFDYSQKAWELFGELTPYLEQRQKRDTSLQYEEALRALKNQPEGDKIAEKLFELAEFNREKYQALAFQTGLSPEKAKYHEKSFQETGYMSDRYAKYRELEDQIDLGRMEKIYGIDKETVDIMAAQKELERFKDINSAKLKLLQEHNAETKKMSQEEFDLKIKLIEKEADLTAAVTGDRAMADEIAFSRKQTAMISLLESSENLADGISAAMKRIDKDVSTTAEKVSGLWMRASSEMSEAFSGSFVSAMKLDMDGILDAWMRMIDAMYNELVRLWANEMVKSLMGESGLFSNIARGVKAAYNPMPGYEPGPFALGGAFDMGRRLTRFATGGVVSNPTLFRMADGMGLMGEAGPEAVMPLTRLPSGELGVKGAGTGGAGGYIININAVDAQSVQNLLKKNKGIITDIVNMSINRNQSIRQTIRRRA
jgi:hypothetical protein